MSLPTADDLFRPTVGEPGPEARAAVARELRSVDPQPSAEHEADRADRGAEARRRSSGRVRHDEKMTVYVTSDELIDLEHARLALRRDHALAVDRGRLVREAIAMALADLEQSGADSELVRRLAGVPHGPVDE